MIVNFLSNAVKFSPAGSLIVIKMTEKDPRIMVPEIGNTGRAKQSEVKQRSKGVKDAKGLVTDDEGGLKDRRRGNLGFWSRMSNKAISCGETDDGTYVQLHFSYLYPIIFYLILLYFIFILFFVFQFISFFFLSEPRKETRDVTVQIIDRGIGISEEDRVGLFNAYSQVRPEQLQQGEFILLIKYYIEAQARGEKKREK